MKYTISFRSHEMSFGRSVMTARVNLEPWLMPTATTSRTE